MKRLSEMQAEIDAWVRAHGGYWDETALVARLAEELGELARAVLHAAGPKRPKPGEPEGDVAEELGDLLWIALCLAGRMGIDAEAALERSIAKIAARDADRHGPR